MRDMNDMLMIQPHLVFDKKFTHLINKRIQLMDANGKVYGGVLGFVGFNKFLNRFQVTVNRTPIFNVNPSAIKLQKDYKIFK